MLKVLTGIFLLALSLKAEKVNSNKEAKPKLPSYVYCKEDVRFPCNELVMNLPKDQKCDFKFEKIANETKTINNEDYALYKTSSSLCYFGLASVLSDFKSSGYTIWTKCNENYSKKEISIPFKPIKDIKGNVAPYFLCVKKDSKDSGEEAPKALPQHKSLNYYQQR